MTIRKKESWLALYMHMFKRYLAFKQSSNFTKIFISGFFVSFIAEGIGIVPRNITFLLFLFFSLFLYVISFKNHQNFPIKNVWVFLGSFLYTLYLLYITSFSLNRQTSFEFIIFILSLFLVCIVIWQQWKELEIPFLYSILGLGIIFCIYSLLLPIALNYNLFFLYPQSGYQYVYSLFGSNNNLGDFLVFPLLISLRFYLHEKRKSLLLLFLFYFLFFLFSYSRAGYIGFLVGMLLLSLPYWRKITHRQKGIVIGFLVAVMLFLILTSSNMLQNENMRFIANLNLIYGKSSIETREEYFLQTLKGFLAYRYYGVGLGNFEYVSKMFVGTPGAWTSSAHNIFLDILVETGTVSFILFTFFVIVLLRIIKEEYKSIYAILLLSWLVMVQFDYLHRMYSYLFLFPVFLAGLLFSRKNKEVKQFDVHLVTVFLFGFLSLFVIVYSMSNILLDMHKYTLARFIYPLKMSAYKKEFIQENKDYAIQKNILDIYTNLFSGDPWGFQQKGRLYQKQGKMRDAIDTYEKAFWLDPFRDLGMAGRIYTLKQTYEDKKKARIFAEKLFMKMHNDTGQTALPYEYWLFINKFCQKVYKLHCIYTLE